ncbi:MAG: hypothetical protein WCM76_06785 [Bacteroidota bacterium]
MKKLSILLFALVILTSCKFYKLTVSDRKIFEGSKMDIKSLQLYSPDYDCIFIAGVEDSRNAVNEKSPMPSMPFPGKVAGESVNTKTCAIERISDVYHERIILRKHTKLTCTSADSTGLFVSLDKAYSPVLFKVTKDGYFHIEKNSFIKMTGKEYYVLNEVFLNVKGKFVDKHHSIIIKLKGNAPECK